MNATINNNLYETKETAEKNIFTGLAVVVGKPESQNENGGHYDGLQAHGSWVRVEDFCLSEPDDTCTGYMQGIRSTVENCGVITDRETAISTAEALASKYNAPIIYR